MKRGTPDHPKTRKLARLLCGGDIAKAVGHLELLWHFTARYAPDGAIGKHGDDDIAAGAFWDGAPGEFVSALVESGYVDENEECRLLIHDWPDHAEDAVHMSLARGRKFFADGTIPKTRRLGGKERQEADEWYRAHAVHTPCTRRGAKDGVVPHAVCTAIPSPSKPSPPKPSQFKGTKFVIPTVEEVTAYCRERKNQVDPNAFVDFYTSKGWIIGKSKMKDWKASVRTWEKNQGGSDGQRQGSHLHRRGRVHERDWSHLDKGTSGNQSANETEGESDEGDSPLFGSGCPEP